MRRGSLMRTKLRVPGIERHACDRISLKKRKETAWIAEEVRFARDSQLEGDGFEPSVPSAKEPLSPGARMPERSTQLHHIFCEDPGRLRSTPGDGEGKWRRNDCDCGIRSWPQACPDSSRVGPAQMRRCCQLGFGSSGARRACAGQFRGRILQSCSLIPILRVALGVRLLGLPAIEFEDVPALHQSVMWRPGKMRFLIGMKNPLPIRPSATARQHGPSRGRAGRQIRDSSRATPTHPATLSHPN